jgi:predicted DNA-binding protein (UPF0251 family)
VESFPTAACFLPQGRDGCSEYIIKIEELEAMRLKDVEGLNQSECAQRMGISRQTFQNIVDSARRKTALALSTGAAIRIAGGHYTARICRLRCQKCGATYAVEKEENKRCCPECGSQQVACVKKSPPCQKWCWKQPK